MELLTLLGNISYRLRGNCEILRQTVKGVTADVRRASEGVLFVCTRTALRDGHLQVTAAYRAGCRAFLVDRRVDLPADAAVLTVPDAEALLGPLAAEFWGHPGRYLTVFGITGSAGKSSVALVLSALLERAGHTVASLTTDGVRIGATRHPSDVTVPDAAELQELLHECRQRGVSTVVLEFSAYMLLHKTAFSIPFAAVLLTNLWDIPPEQGAFATPAAYRAAKLSLLQCPAAVRILPNSLAYLAGDRGWMTFGEGGDLSADRVTPRATRDGLETNLILHFPNGEKQAVSLPVPGDFAVDNTMAAAAMAMCAGIPCAAIAKGLSRYFPVGRMELVSAFARRYVFVDSAYDPASLGRALRILRRFTDTRLTVVLGSVGGRAFWRRAPLGRVAAAYADFVYLTADDPDCEDPVAICTEMVDEEQIERFAVIPDRRAAIRRAVLELRPGDILLIAGKGACGSQLICGKRHLFCEKDIVNEAMERF